MIIILILLVLLLIRYCGKTGPGVSDPSGSGSVNGSVSGSLVSLTDGSSEPSGSSDVAASGDSSIQKPEIGDEFIWGTYEQDADESNGQEDIVWIILDSTDDAVLLLSLKNLDTLRYNETESGSATWETCTLRTWLNGSFLDTAFTEEERARIMATDISTADNDVFGTPGGNDTTDNVFLLSIEEVTRYFPVPEDRQALNTDYARTHGAYDNGGYGNWWLRSPGTNSSAAKTVSCFGGESSDSGTQMWDDINAVRPSLWLNVG